jgi:hypothetical protein
MSVRDIISPIGIQLFNARNFAAAKKKKKAQLSCASHSVCANLFNPLNEI